MNIKILYEDNHIIAVIKPAGVLSQGDKSGDISMYDMVKDYIRIKKGKPSLLNPGNVKPRTEASASSTGVFLGLLHRLDGPVMGIMLFAKTSKGASRLSEQFRNHTVEKTYHALVLGKPAGQKGILQNKLGKDVKLKKGVEYQDGVEAHLYYELVKTGKPAPSRTEGYSLLNIKIDTGKFHQIRTQLSLAGLPIVGDVKYGGPAWDNPNAIALCATSLVFMTATDDKKVELLVEIPEKWQEYLSTVKA